MPHSSYGAPNNPAASPTVVAFGSATVSSSAKAITHDDFGFTAAQLAESKRAVISCHGDAMHYRYDGGNPTATVGHMSDDATMNAPQVIVGNTNINNLIFIREDTTDVVVSITLEK